MFINHKGGMTFVLRTPTVGTDWGLPAFTWDGTWHLLDMSAIVPLAAKAVLVTISHNWNNTALETFLRHPDDTCIGGSVLFKQPVAHQTISRTILLPVKNATIAYQQWNGTGQYFNWQVLGWFL